MERTIKRRVLLMLKDGVLTFDEVVKLSGVSRYTVYRWCKAAGIDARATRMRRAFRHWEASALDRRKKPHADVQPPLLAR